MRVYTEANMENLRARKLLVEWQTEGFLSDAQYQKLEQETVSELRATNLFLRLALFLFTVICVAAATGLFFLMFLHGASQQAATVLLLIFAAASYGAAEYAVSEFNFYHHGIEEALAVCSLGFLCAGLLSTFGRSLVSYHYSEFLVSSVGAAFSLWIWHRFGLWYAFLGAMIFAVILPADWTSSHVAQRILIVVFYAIGLFVIATIRSHHRVDYLAPTYSLAEAFLWLGIYLTLNLQIFAWDFPRGWFGAQASHEFSGPFYWITWVLIWCLPPVVLARGIAIKDRFIIAVGAVVGILTLVSNKPYLGWQRHTWDPMLLGIVLAGAAFFLRRWLAQGPDGVRYGFTAAPLSKKERGRLNTGSSAFGLLSPHPQPDSPDLPTRGGESGGGGAVRDF